MYFVVKNEEVRQNLIKEIESLPLDKGMVVDIREKTRTLPQNALWHKWVGILASECGYTPKDMKNTLKRSVLGMEEFINFETGEVQETDVATSELKTKGFTELMDKTQQIANEMDIILPSPNYYGVEI